MKFCFKNFFITFVITTILSFVRLAISYIFPQYLFNVFRPFAEVIDIILYDALLVIIPVIGVSVLAGFSKNIITKVICSILAFITCFWGFFSFDTTDFFGHYGYSETTLIENYFVLDNEDSTKNDVSHFPKKEEFENAINAEYYYLFDMLQKENSIILTLSYDEETYLVEKQKVLDEFSDNEQVLENGKLKIVIYYYVNTEPDAVRKFGDANISLNDNEKTIRYYVYEEWGF